MNTKPPFKQFDYVEITHRVPNPQNIQTVGVKSTVVNVVNTATKKNPIWRIYLSNGLWCDPDVLELATAKPCQCGMWA